MRKADLLFVVSIVLMSVGMMYAMWTKNLALFAIFEAGALLDIIAYARYNRRG
jgi:hypothetical protein